jgi:hypothetical protein
MVFGRKLCLPCDLLFGVSLDKDQPTTAYVADLVEQLHDIHYNGCQHLNVTSNRFKACYDHLVNTTVLWLWRVAVNTLDKQLQTADKGWFSRFGVGQELTTPCHKK